MAGAINKIKLYSLILYLSLTYIMITVVSSFNISGNETEIATPVNALLVATATIVQAIFIFFIYASKKKLYFFILLFTSAAVNVIFAVAFSLLINRDYFTIPFQIVIIHYIAFVSKYQIVSLKSFYIKTAQIVSYIAISALLLWEIIVGYSIMTRTEPRWLESIFYNIYNLGLIVILCYNAINFSYTKKIKLVFSDKSIFLSDIDMTKVLNEDYVSLVKSMLNNKNKCYEIFNAEAKFQKNCEKCLKDNLPVESCEKFNILYDKIENIRKIMSFLRIGKIIVPINKDRLKYDGWKVVLSKDLIIEKDAN